MIGFSPFYIRPATSNDTRFVARAILEAVGVPSIGESMLESQRVMCAREDVLYSWRNTRLLECDGKVAGSLTSYDARHYRRMKAVTFPLIREMCGKDFTDMPDEASAGEYYLDSLYVSPEFRHRGIGSALLRDGIEQARRLRLPRVSLIVERDHHDAQRLYHSLGFEKIDRIHAFQGDYIKMSISLNYNPLLEVCAASVNSAFTAERAGAPRIELCQRLDLGGLTPDRQDIARCVSELSLQTFVLIRPRGGNFCYSPEEFSTIMDDIRYCQSAGAAGVVVGFLNEDGSVQEEQCRRAVEAAYPMQVTFHRAFDRCRHWPSALEQIIECGFNRILTSGQKATAMEGCDTLREIQRQSNGRIIILAGSGVNAANAQKIMQTSGVTELHGSCKRNGYESDPNEIQLLLKQLVQNP